MKSRRAAAFAFVVVAACAAPQPPPGSYYLMYPPTGINAPRGNPSAPLSQWTISGYRYYSSQEECLRALGSESGRVEGLGASVGTQVSNAAQCVATDDPRLKEK